MEVRYLPTPEHFERMTTTEIRDRFLLTGLFVPGEIKLVYSHADRMVIGGIVPGASPLKLEADRELAASFFAERREIGVFNFGGTGIVRVDGVDYPTENFEMVYIGLGKQEITFASADPVVPARFFLVSLPAHQAYPTTRITREDSNRVALGDQSQANTRAIYQYIHRNGIKSCQLVMGVTVLQAGNVWNTMPPHTHDRRSEVYMYFDLAGDNIVFHFLGQGHETRHLVVREGDAVISPAWSIHAGAGTHRYCFVWAMGGENQSFDDMDYISLVDLA
jgi:4-deoxy-L-threo-5-hexosulose-uronate ketol-isomerase